MVRWLHLEHPEATEKHRNGLTRHGQYEIYSGTSRLTGVMMLLALMILTGCRNACQEVCVELDAIAEDRCGLEFSDEQFKSCISEHNRLGIRRYLKDKYGENAPTVGDRLAICDEVLLTLDEDITCQDIELYFTDGNIGGTDTGT